MQKRTTILGAFVALLMLTSALPGTMGASSVTSDGTLDGADRDLALRLVEEHVEGVVDQAEAVADAPSHVRFLPPLTREDAVNRAQNVLVEISTPLSLAQAMEAMTSDDPTMRNVPEVEALALSVFAYYATVGYEEDPAFGEIARADLQQAVALLVDAGGSTESYVPELQSHLPSDEDVLAFVNDLRTREITSVRTFTPQGQELGRDVDVIETEFLETLDVLTDSYRETRTLDVDVLDATWDHSWTAFYYMYSQSYYSYGAWYHENVYRQVDGYDHYQEYREAYESTLSVQEFLRAVESRDYQHMFTRIERVQGIASVPFAQTAGSEAGGAEATLLGTMVIPFAFQDTWWQVVLDFDFREYAESVDESSGESYGEYSYTHYWRYRYWDYVDGVKQWNHWHSSGHYHYHRHWHCGWTGCWIHWHAHWHDTSYWHTHYDRYTTTRNHGTNEGTTTTTSPWNTQYGNAESATYSNEVRTSTTDSGGYVTEMPGVVVAPEGTITFKVPAKQYALLARESTPKGALDSRTDLDLGDDAIPFTGIGSLPTQLETSRYDEQCSDTFVIAPTPNDCSLIVDEDAPAGQADASDAEAGADAALFGVEAELGNAAATAEAAAATAEDAAADPEAFLAGAMPEVPEVPEPTVPEVPEPTVPEVPEPTVPEVPEPPTVTPPEAPDADAMLGDLEVTVTDAFGDAEGRVADAIALAEAIAADPEGFATGVADALEADARDTTVDTPEQGVDTVTVNDDEYLDVAFQVAEFTSGAVYVASIGLVAKDGLTAIDPEDILVTVTGRGVAGDSPTFEHSQNTPCYDSQITGDGGSGLFPTLPDTTPGDCVRDSGEGESAVFRIVHAIDLDGDDAFTGVDATSTNVGATADATEATANDAAAAAEAAADEATSDVPDVDPENPPELPTVDPENPPETPEVPDPGLPEPPA